MRIKECLSILMTVSLLAHVPLAYSADGRPSGEQVELHWRELGPVIAQGRVTTVLPDGTALQGLLLAVNEDALVLDVKKSSDKKAHPKGRTSILRDQITTLSLRETKGIVGRTALTLAGILGTGGLTGPLLASESRTAGAVVLGAVIGGGVGGYYLGRRIDHKTTLIRILPNDDRGGVERENQ